MNKVVLIGNLTKDPELVTLNNGNCICKFTLAVKRQYTNQNGEYESDFISIVASNNVAEKCKKYLAKGKKAAVYGSLLTRSYETDDGSTRYVTEVRTGEVEFLTPPTKESNESKEEPKPVYQPIDDDNLPF